MYTTSREDRIYYRRRAVVGKDTRRLAVLCRRPVVVRRNFEVRRLTRPSSVSRASSPCRRTLSVPPPDYTAQSTTTRR